MQQPTSLAAVLFSAYLLVPTETNKETAQNLKGQILCFSSLRLLTRTVAATGSSNKVSACVHRTW